MITITREDSEVKVSIDGGPLDSSYPFTYVCNNKYYAELLRQHFQKALWDRIESIRRQEYERGYKDGRGKQLKKKYFYTSMKNTI